ncbi:MAG: glycoside hydrolase family 2, partial [Fibrobacteres bacterium]|nr:glycoside hydrolase family 2 [Fibrobacterota bacterium]
MRSSDFVPMRNTDWFNYGGLYRDVELFRVPKVFIKSLKVHLIPDGKFNRITFKAELDGSIGNEPLTFSIPELGICEDVRPKDCIASVTVTANPELWTPDNPKLYKVTAEYGKDIVSDKIGFREIKTKGTEILLNGKSLFLRGICVHEDDAELGKTTNQEDIIRRFSHAKTLGCNFLRLAHYPHHEMVSQLADELGILLWEEIPVYWAINFTNKATYENAENQLLELINRDYNRASVILWSVGNENLDTEDRLKFMSKLAKAAKKSDPTRLISAACFVNKEERTIDDRLIEHLDIIGINEYYGWYIREYDEIKKIFAHAEVTKPVIITETGADALSGNHGTTEDLFTEEQMEEVYKNQVEIISKVDYIRGLTPWILYDFRSPRRQNYYQKGYNRKGLIAQDKKTPKLAFYILQEFYRSIQNKEENS